MGYAMAETTAGRPVSFSDIPVVAEQRMMLVCWIWQRLVPLCHSAITPNIAAELWAIYRAACREKPFEVPDEVRAMMRWTNELWLLHIQTN